MKCDLCEKTQGYRNRLGLKAMVAAGGQLARVCRSCQAALDEGLKLVDEYGFGWSRNAVGDLICKHEEATND